MKTTELAHVLDQISSILKQLPSIEIPDALTYIHHMIQRPSTGNEPITSQVSSHPGPTTAMSLTSELPNLVQQLEQIEPSALEAYIRTTQAWKSKSSMQALARELSISFASRTTKEQLLQSIVTHFEMRRTHGIIRNHRYVEQVEVQLDA